MKHISIAKQESCADGTKKLLLQTTDNHYFEMAVFLFQNRWGACISSQLGCVFNCCFCKSGEIDFYRNLTGKELLEQINIARDQLPAGDQLDFINFMGIGEPLLNIDNIISTMNQVKENHNPATFSLSTIGLKNKIQMFCNSCLESGHFVQIQVSLHGATDAQRNEIFGFKLPANIADVLDQCEYCSRQFLDKGSRGKYRGKIKLKYFMIKEVNDDEKSLNNLVSLVKNRPFLILLAPINPVYRDFQPSNETRINYFSRVLLQNNIDCVVESKSAGLNIGAGCGQLAIKKLASGGQGGSFREKPLAGATY